MQTIEEFVEEQLSSGKFADRDELIREALRIMQARELATSELADELSGPVQRLKQGDCRNTLRALERVSPATMRRERIERRIPRPPTTLCMRRK